jgi:Na+-transporting NADH:ubiquinone oxidoreductase subunit A
MVQMKIEKGLDIPIIGKPVNGIHPIDANGRLMHPEQISLNLFAFEEVKFKLLVKPGDAVKIGQALAYDKAVPNRKFVAPAAGVVSDIRRGVKRRLLDIVIDVSRNEEEVVYPVVDINSASAEQIAQALAEGGLFAHIRKRPFNQLAHPEKLPRAIFVKAVESAPFAVPAEMQVEGHEEDFAKGLQALKKLTTGDVHLVHRAGTSCRTFTDAPYVKRHSVEGPHPASNYSVHIHYISPIQNPEEVVWTVNVHDVIAIGHLLTTGHYFTSRVISIAGPGILPERRSYALAREGYPISGLIAGRIEKGSMRLISGDVLMGQKVEQSDFLGFYHYAFCVVPEGSEREFLHFFRLGTDKYSASRAYLSGHLDNSKREYNFTTSQHGEHRYFVTSDPYDAVMPMTVPTMQLIKAIMAEDYDLAESYGLLEVDAEDFALPTFVCPSKIEMTEIVKSGMQTHAKEVLS